MTDDNIYLQVISKQDTNKKYKKEPILIKNCKNYEGFIK